MIEPLGKLIGHLPQEVGPPVWAGRDSSPLGIDITSFGGNAPLGLSRASRGTFGRSPKTVWTFWSW
jgi:hypothetical protein